MKTMRGRLFAVSAALFLAAAGLAACKTDNPNPGDGSKTEQLTGDVKADGSSTVGPLTKAAASLFAEEQPKVNVTVGISGTGGGFKKFCAGETDISDASRKIKAEGEKSECDKNGIKFAELIVANDALTVVVNKDATWVDCLTVPQLKAVWEPNSKVNNWNQIDPKFPNEPLKLYGAGTDSGTFDYFTLAINGKEKASRTDYQPSEDDNVIVQGVAASKGGMGYFGYTYFEENTAKLKALKIDGGKGCVAPSVAAAQDGSYAPLSRPLFIYVSDKSLAKPQVKAFIDFYVAKIDDAVKEAKFVPLTAAQKATLASEYAKLKG